MYLMSAVAAACLLILPAAGAAQCDPDGDVEFVCRAGESRRPGRRVPDSPWVIVSSMMDDGHLYATDARDHSSRPIFPLDTSAPRHDTALYGACPGPDTSGFQPHGLGLRPGDEGVHTLYVVRHGARESVRGLRARRARRGARRHLDRLRGGARRRRPELGCGAPGRRLRRHQLPALDRRAVGVAAGRRAGRRCRAARPPVPTASKRRPTVNGSTSAAGHAVADPTVAGPDAGGGRLGRRRLPRRQRPLGARRHAAGGRPRGQRARLHFRLSRSGRLRRGHVAGGEGHPQQPGQGGDRSLSVERFHHSGHRRHPGVEDEIWVGAVGGGTRIGRFPAP